MEFLYICIMKSLKDILAILLDKKEYLERKYSLSSMAVFGSYARQEAIDGSDVDIIVDFERPIGIEFIDLADELEQILHLKVDLVSHKGIKPKYFQSIKQDLKYV